MCWAGPEHKVQEEFPKKKQSSLQNNSYPNKAIVVVTESTKKDCSWEEKEYWKGKRQYITSAISGLPRSKNSSKETIKRRIIMLMDVSKEEGITLIGEPKDISSDLYGKRVNEGNATDVDVEPLI